MTYNDWITQLKQNLLSVPDEERKRVMDYYAEAYADRRAAGFSENEIIDGFGAPYDAAQAILEGEFESGEGEKATHMHKTEDAPPPPPPSYHTPTPPEKTVNKSDYTWVFVLLCIVLAIPIFSLVMAMVGITIGFAVAPFSIVATGAGFIFGGIGEMFSSFTTGLVYTGIGLIIIAVGIPLFKVFFMLVKLMWELFGKFFKWLAGLFKGGSK